jgi:glutaredoxin
MHEPVVILYTRPGCHLCEVARTVLERYGLKPREVDIESDPALVARYTNDIPVVSIDGIERFRGRVDEVLLRRLLAGRNSRNA